MSIQHQHQSNQRNGLTTEFFNFQHQDTPRIFYYHRPDLHLFSFKTQFYLIYLFNFIIYISTAYCVMK